MESNETAFLENIPNPRLFKPSTYLKGFGWKLGKEYGKFFAVVMLLMAVVGISAELFFPSLANFFELVFLIVGLTLPYHGAKRALKIVHQVKLPLNNFQLLFRHLVGWIIFYGIILLLSLAVMVLWLVLNPPINNVEMYSYLLTKKLLIILGLTLPFLWPFIGGGWIVYGHLNDLKRKGKLSIIS